MSLILTKNTLSKGLTHLYAPGESTQNLAVYNQTDRFVLADWGVSKLGKLAGAIDNIFPSITLGTEFTLLLVFRTQTVGAAPLGGRKLFTTYGSGGIAMDAIHSVSSYSGALYYGSSFTIAGKPTEGVLVDNTDYSLIIVKSGNTIKTFLNGVLTVDHSGSISLSNSTFKLNPNLSGSDPATIDPVLFSLFGKYDRALSDNEAKLLSRQPRQIFQSDYLQLPFTSAIAPVSTLQQMSLLTLSDKRVKQPFTHGKTNSRVLFANHRFSKLDIATQSEISGIAIANGVADNFTGSEHKKTSLKLPDTPITIMIGAIQTADTGFRYLFASNYNSGLVTEPFTLRAYNGALEITSYNGSSSSVSITGAASGTYNTYFAELGAVGVDTATIGYITKSGVITKTSGSFSRLSANGYDLYVGAGANGTTPWRNYDAPILFTAIFRGKLSDSEKISIAKNPWQIFEPDYLQLPFAQTASIQLLSPIEDISSGGIVATSGMQSVFLPEIETNQPKRSTSLNYNIGLLGGSYVYNASETTYKYGDGSPVSKVTTPAGRAFKSSTSYIVQLPPPKPIQDEFVIFATGSASATGNQLLFSLGGNVGGAFCYVSYLNNTPYASIRYYDGGDVGFVSWPTPVSGVHTIAYAIGKNNNRKLWVDGYSVDDTSGNVSGATTFSYMQALGLNRGGDIIPNSSEDTLTYAGGLLMTNNANLLAKQISKNPWQIFAKNDHQVFFPYQSTSGAWLPSAGTTLYGVLDETVSDNSDYISTTSASTCELRLGAGLDPLSSVGHILRYTILAGTGTLAVSLKQGSTVIATWNHTLTASVQNIENTLSTTEADSITNYSNLSVTFTSNN